MNKDLYWPIGISVTLILFVAGLIGFMIFSKTVPVNLVSENYYENSLNYQQQIDESQRASEVKNDMTMQYDLQQQSLNILIPNLADNSIVDGEVYFFRPSDSRKDRRIALAVDDGGQQLLSLADFDKGLWRVRLSWNVNKTSFYTEEVLVIQ